MTVEIQLLWAWAITHVRAMKRELHDHPERGDGILIWVIMTALLAAAAIAIVAVIVAKAKSTAGNTKTQ